MNVWVDVIAWLLQGDVQKNVCVFSLRMQPSLNGCRILIWLPNDEVTQAAGRWRHERVMQASSLQVVQHISLEWSLSALE